MSPGTSDWGRSWHRRDPVGSRTLASQQRSMNKSLKPPGQSRSRDFLTVGSVKGGYIGGDASQIVPFIGNC